MSMNLYLEATREVVVVKTGEKSEQSIGFDLHQTPTCVTREALAGDPLLVYSEWKLGMAETPEELFEADEHLREVRAWISTAEKSGYEIEFYEM